MKVNRSRWYASKGASIHVMFGSALGHFRHGSRLALRRPVQTTASVLILACAIGLNAGVDALVGSFLHRPLGLPSSDDLYAVYSYSRRNTLFSQLSSGELAALVTSPVISPAGGAAAAPLRAGVVLGGTSLVISASLVSPNYFKVLGLEASHGRLFNGDDVSRARAEPLAVISDSLTARFGPASPVGRELMVGGVRCLAIGTIPDAFRGITGRSVAPSMMWILDPSGHVAPALKDRRGLEVYVRLADGVGHDAAAAALSATYQAVSGDAAPLGQSIRLVEATGVVFQPSVDAQWTTIGTSPAFFRHSFCSLPARILWLLESRKRLPGTMRPRSASRLERLSEP